MSEVDSNGRPVPKVSHAHEVKAECSEDLPPVIERTVSEAPYSIFSPATKTWMIFLVSVSALISPFAATTYYPALNVLSDVLSISPTMVNVSITTYMVYSPYDVMIMRRNLHY